MIQRQINMQANDEQNFPKLKPTHPEPIPIPVEPKKIEKESEVEFLGPYMLSELQINIEKLKYEVRKKSILSRMPLE